MISAQPIIGIGIVCTLFLAVFYAMSMSFMAQMAGPETRRKSLHILIGLLSLSFPLLFDEIWPVVVLALLCGAFLLAVRMNPGMRERFQGALAQVGRDSYGEFFFLVALVVVFWLARGDPLLYVIPILNLSVADSAAALIGKRYGVSLLESRREKKSVEGSVAFFVACFLSTHIPLLLFSSVGRSESLLIAAIVALLITLAEGISWEGLDNLFIPVGSYALLRIFLSLSLDELWFRAAACGIVLVAAVALRRRTTLDDSALLAGCLAGYFVMVAGGLSWLWALLAVPLIDTLFTTKAERLHRVHSVGAVACVSVPVLFLAVVRGEYALRTYLPIVCAICATHVAIFQLSVLLARDDRLVLRVKAVVAFLRAWISYQILYGVILFVGMGNRSLFRIAADAEAMGLAIAAGLAIFCFALKPARGIGFPDTQERWVLQSLASVAAALVALTFDPP